MKHHRFLIPGAAVLAIALAVSAPLAASAHVRIDPDQASPGGYTVITFRVPTESATAGTVGLEVDFPTDTPFTSVSYQPVAGWSAAVTTAKLPKPVRISGATVTEAPSKIVWTADSGVQVAPGQFQQFSIQAGIVPDTGKIMLPAIQTYSDGTVVKWDQPTPASGVEPEHPAPILYVNDAPPSTTAPSIVSTASAPPSSSATDVVALGLGVAGIALGAIALVVAVFAVSRRQRAKGAEASGARGPAGAAGQDGRS